MKKVIAAIIWIVLLNGAFTILYAVLMTQFNPTITHDEAYKFGGTYGAYFLYLSAVLIVYLATTSRLPGARPQR